MFSSAEGLTVDVEDGGARHVDPAPTCKNRIRMFDAQTSSPSRWAGNLTSHGVPAASSSVLKTPEPVRTARPSGAPHEGTDEVQRLESVRAPVLDEVGRGSSQPEQNRSAWVLCQMASLTTKRRYEHRFESGLVHLEMVVCVIEVGVAGKALRDLGILTLRDRRTAHFPRPERLAPWCSPPLRATAVAGPRTHLRSSPARIVTWHRPHA